MYQFSGWVDIVDDPDAVSDVKIEAVVAGVESLIDSFRWDNATGEVSWFNGSSILSIAGAGNRPRAFPTEIRAILHYLAAKAPSSYGLIHWRDDEDLDPAAREIYHVIALRRGTIVETTEPLLSPIVPTIEP